MTSSWVWPAIGALLVWTPLVSTILLRKKDETRRLSWTPSAKALFSYWPNWVDFIRCLVAMGLLVGWSTATRADDPASGKIVLGIIMAITLVGCFIQAIIVHTRRTLFAPLPIILAAALFIPGLDLGIFAVVVTCLFCTASNKFEFLLPILAGIIVVGGIVLGTSRLDLVVAAFLVVFPQFFAIMFTRRLVLPSNVVLSHQ